MVARELFNDKNPVLNDFVNKAVGLCKDKFLNNEEVSNIITELMELQTYDMMRLSTVQEVQSPITPFSARDPLEVVGVSKN